MESSVVKDTNIMEKVPSASELSLSDSSGGHSPVIAPAAAVEAPHATTAVKTVITPDERQQKKGMIDDGEEKSDDVKPLNDDNAGTTGGSDTSLPIYNRQNSITTFDNLVGRVIGSTNLMELVACPCCQQCFDDTQPGTLNEPNNMSCTRRHLADMTARGKSLFSVDSNDEDDDISEEEDVLPGVLSAGVHYRVRRIIVEGWLHKKGTGKDWFGSRSWKPRWARLASARVDGYDFDVPLLLIYWYPASTTASTVIVLDSTVVLAIDLEDKEKWNSRFDIRHVPKENDGSEDAIATRTFTAPRKGRDAWVLSISQALLSYEKQKDKARKKASRSAAETASLRARSLSPERAMTFPAYNDIWTGDRFVKVELRSPMSPPGSPPPPPRTRHSPHPASPPIPRPAPPRRHSATLNKNTTPATNTNTSSLLLPTVAPPHET